MTSALLTELDINPERMAESYDAFLARKQNVAPSIGFDPGNTLPPFLKPFQRDIVRWALRRGRAALFEGTGLGKTVQQLSWARAVAHETQGRVLVFAPLGVARQTVEEEAPKWGFDGVRYAESQKTAAGDIVVTNYERLASFDPSDFAGVVLDESGIIKDASGKTRMEITDACRQTFYKLCASATPAPNDYTELGTHAEFLDVMSEKEMLAMYFVHEGSVRADPNGEEWRLKRHAASDFWRWVASWAVVIQNPNDLGYDEPGYHLPPLHLHQVTVATEARPLAGMLFPVAAQTLQDRIAVRRDTVKERAEAAARIIAENGPDDAWAVWCNLNDEADAIRALVPGLVEVRGSDKPELKAERLIGFAHGEPRMILTKPKIASRGMNWQHCRKFVCVGLNDSFEQLFQLIRRFWRFGQEQDVHGWLIASELEGAVVANLKKKEAKYDAMMAAMVDHMKDLSTAEIRGGRQTASTYEPTQPMELPRWMAA